MELAESEDPDFKHHVLPLARIKKVMKSDEDVQVSSLINEGRRRETGKAGEAVAVREKRDSTSSMADQGLQTPSSSPSFFTIPSIPSPSIFIG